ncbi:hypothetical protein CDEST_01414 [Colletotrichum destructivum]|uniref:Uncharacterized protein n=1 Tax=Colletotrichum destructivum TaxID=34406 RepID=A0AAX4HZM8_9PEZI|nr:hypothetical protein CDEST_01414 [Colletotrichum destructivum]
MPRSSTLQASTPTSPQSAASALAAYRQKILDRLPVFVSASYHDAIRDVIQAQVDAPNLDCRLRWVVEVAYHNNTEPMSHEVVTLCYPCCSLARFGRRNTSRLNSLVESLSLKKFARPNAAASIPGDPGSFYVGPLPLASASPFSLGIPDTRNAPAPANIPGNTFENHWTVAEKASNTRIAEHHQQTRDKPRQAAARQPLEDDGAGIRDLAAYVAESHGLVARVRLRATPDPDDHREDRAGAIAAGGSSSRRQRKLRSRWQVE